MTAEWLHLPPPYPPGVGPLCGAELEAWYEDLQDILGSDGGGAKLARAPPCSEKEPEFLDVLESCSLTWLTDGVGVGVGGEAWAEAQGDRERGSDGERGGSGGGDLLPPEFFELLSEGGVGVVETAGIMQDKRKRGNSLSFPSSGSRSSSSSSSAKKSRREKEQEKERKVQELTDQNERLKAEIDRLGEEVQRTRRALIERLVNTRKS
ncbi:hypothetical protein J4Q44_G00099530 [Coregonus suidteri]|uniref:DNA damage-inducible transcript 3 protein n=1 Tax=Coregonus suidteri TaxID=861788 RepID=A0AAN8R9I6_9TELE